MMASIIATPIALALEHKKILPAWQAAITIPGMDEMKLATLLLTSGLYMYTYNEFAFKVLGLVSPVAQVATLNRSVIYHMS